MIAANPIRIPGRSLASQGLSLPPVRPDSRSVLDCASPLALSPVPLAAASVPPALIQLLRPNATSRWLLPSLAAITPTYIEQTLRGAFYGSHIQAWALFDLMEDTWPRLQKNLNELKRAVVKLDWKLEPWAEDDQPPSDTALERKKLVSNAIWRMRPDPTTDEKAFGATVYDLLDAWGKGTSIMEVLWEVRTDPQLGDITAPRATAWVHPMSYAWDTDGRLGLNPNSLARNTQPGTRGYESGTQYQSSTAVLPFPDYQFLIGICKAKTGHPVTGGLLRSLAWWWCAANFSSDWLMNLAQIFGLPFRWATYAAGASQATVNEISSMLETMGSAGWGAFPEGATLDFKEAGKVGENSPQGDLVDRADKNCDLLILGQTLTTSQGDRGSQALGRVHMEVRTDVIEAAAGYVIEILNHQLIPAICILNYGDADECPEICATPHEQKDYLANAQRDSVLLQAGAALPMKWFYDRHDIPLPQPGEETIEQAQPQSPSPLGGERAGNGTDAPKQLAAKSIEPSTINHQPSTSQLALAHALATDLQPIVRRLAAILQIEDVEIQKAKFQLFLADIERLEPDLARDPGAAHVLDRQMATAMASGLTQKA